MKYLLILITLCMALSSYAAEKLVILGGGPAGFATVHKKIDKYR